MTAYLTLLRHNRPFRNLWLATLISYAGDWLNLLACAALIGRLTESGTAVSLLFLARFLPLFVLSPLAGVLADRYDRKTIMIVTDLLRALTVLGFIAVQATGAVWLLYLLTVIQFSLSSLFQPAHAAIIPNIVADADLVPANALDGLTWSVMLAVGALIGGIATTLLGITACFVIDSLSFVLSAWFVSRIAGPTRQAAITTSSDAGIGHEFYTGLRAYVDGLHYLRLRPWLLGIALVKTGGATVWGAMDVLQLPLARTQFPLGEQGALSLAIFYAMTGVGSAFGPVVVQRWLGSSQRASLWGIQVGFLLSVIGVYWLGVAHGLSEAALSVLLRTFGGGVIWVFSTTLLQMLTEDAFRGRVIAFEFAALTLMQSLATLWAGFAQDVLHYSPQAVLRLTTFAPLLVAVIWAIFQFRWRDRTQTVPSL